MNDVVVNSALRATLLSLQRTSRSIDVTSLRLATGLKVNSALDNPQNFFASESLRSSSSDYNRLLDGISQSSRTVEEALIGVEAATRLTNQAEAIVQNSRELLVSGQEDLAIFEELQNISPAPLSQQILSARPDVYFQLNDAGSPGDTGLGGGVGASYNGGVTQQAPALYNNGGTFSAQFDGINDRVQVNDSGLINVGSRTERTMELVFNADDVTSRQVIYEEGGGVNSLMIYVNNGELFITGTDDDVWGPNSPQGPTNIRTAVNAGETYHVAFVFSSVENRFEGYVNGTSIGSVSVGSTIFPSHNGDIGIGGMRGGAWFDDFRASGNAFHFDGRISDVAIYNDVLADAVISSHANSLNSSETTLFKHRDYEKVVNQLEALAQDTQYRGINLLANDNLTTFFNPESSNTLVTEGIDLEESARALKRNDFNVLEDLDEILEQIDDLRDRLREYGASLASNLNVIQTREVYTREKINTLESGADDLVVADQNQEGANLLAQQTRQALGTTALNLSAVSNAQVLRLF